MKPHVFLAYFAVSLTLISSPLRAEDILWARGAYHFSGECPGGKGTCVLALVTSPDGRKSAKVSLREFVPSFEIVEGLAHHSLRALSKVPELPFVEMEIFWSPDSSAVSFAWNTTAIFETTRVYTLTTEGPKSVDLGKIMSIFSRDDPPCVGVPGSCAYRRSGADANSLTVAWSGPHTVVLMAEASESSSYGKNLAQVEGFEVDASTGKVLRKMQAREFKQRWQARMGWNFIVPRMSCRFKHRRERPGPFPSVLVMNL